MPLKLNTNFFSALYSSGNTMGARTDKAGFPAQATSMNLLPELKYINKSSAH